MVHAAIAFTIWGLFPLYLREVAAAGALEVVAHRILWSLVFVLALLAWRGQWRWLAALRHRPRVLGLFVLTASLVTANWLIYTWSVQNGHVIDSSLGYFINPLVNVLLGVLVLGERPRRLQWAAIALAAGGVLWLAVQAGRLPWIGLALAISFGLYGLLRKTAPLEALEGLTLETLLLAPVSATVIGWWTWHGTGGLVQPSLPLLLWLLLAGPLTAVPLLLFASAARRIPLATLGLMQYIGPSLQFMLAVAVFHEPLQPARLIGFVVIWLALALYTLESWWNSAGGTPSPSAAVAAAAVRPERGG